MSSSSSGNYGTGPPQAMNTHGGHVYDLDVALQLGGYNYWATSHDSQHYHYDHHDYHALPVYRQPTNQYAQHLMPQPPHAQLIFPPQPPNLQTLSGPGIPGNPRLPFGQTDFFQRMHMLSASSSESDDDNDFDPPFVTSLPRNSDNSSTASTATPAPIVPLPQQPPAPPIIQPKKAQTMVIGSSRTLSSTAAARAGSTQGTTAIVIHTPMFKSTRDENGKYHETRKNCVICKKRINTFCRDCKTALCFSDGRDPSATTCWEKHHNNIAISSMARPSG